MQTQTIRAKQPTITHIEAKSPACVDLFCGFGDLSLGIEYADEIRSINRQTFLNGKKDGPK